MEQVANVSESALNAKVSKLTKEIMEMKPKVDKIKDIENYVNFIRKNLAKAYALWNIAEINKDHETFFNFVTDALKVGSKNDQEVLIYNNEVKDSTCLVNYKIMALVHLKRIKEAYGTLKYWMVFNKSTIIHYNGNWPRMENADPKEDIFEEFPKLKQDLTPNSDVAYLFICLIPIKLEVISDMKTRIKDRNCLFQAFADDDQEVIERLEKKYPKTVGVSMRELNNAMFDGMDKKSYEAQLAKQIDLLKSYVFMCYDSDSQKSLHPKFVEDVLEFDNKFTNDVIDSHLDEKISFQTKESASLRSVWSYFGKVFNDANQDRAKLIQSILKQLSEKLSIEWPTKVRTFPIECNPRNEALNPANNVVPCFETVPKIEGPEKF